MSDETAALLRLLVEGDVAAVAAALHADVVFVQGDGTEHRGADVVLAMFSGGAGDVRYAVLAVEASAVRVELSVPGIPGAVRFSLFGVSEAGPLFGQRTQGLRNEFIRSRGRSPHRSSCGRGGHGHQRSHRGRRAS